eukprot:a843757_81.p3 GENE.a843757_81~~a843757_81.p3  ORF type:complete len:111 (+),score=45.59 a843757_81:33-335(+)
MPSGNGARAKQTRERKLKEAAKKKGPTSQLKVNEAAANIQCSVCRQTFLCTSNETTLRDHLNRHDGVEFATAFPTWDPEASGKKKKTGGAAEPDKPKART